MMIWNSLNFSLLYLIVPYYIVLINFLALVVALLSRRLVKEIAKPAKPKDDGGGPKTYRLAHNPAAIQQAQGVPPAATPLTPFQRVQALMPPRNAPAAPQQTQGSVAPATLPPTRARRGRARAPRRLPNTGNRRPTGAHFNAVMPQPRLPPDWELRVTPYSRPYYANNRTQETTWDRPEFSAIEPSAIEPQSSSVPAVRVSQPPDHSTIERIDSNKERLFQIVEFYATFGYENSKKQDFDDFCRIRSQNGYYPITNVPPPAPGLSQPPNVNNIPKTGHNYFLLQNIQDFFFTYGLALSTTKDFELFCAEPRNYGVIPYIRFWL